MWGKYMILKLNIVVFALLASCGQKPVDSKELSYENLEKSNEEIRLVTDEGDDFSPKKRVVVIAGQSNALGWAKRQELPGKILDYGFTRTKVWNGQRWERFSLDNRVGLEPALAYKYEKENPNDLLYIVKHAVDATTLEKGNKHWHPDDKSHYSYLVEKLYKPALSSLGTNVEVMAMLWFQGESDSLVQKKASHYDRNLKKLYDHVSKDMPEVKNFVIGGIPDKGIWKYQKEVRVAQEKLAENHGNVKIINTDSATYFDSAHYDVKSYNSIVNNLWTKINAEALIR